MKVEVLYIEGCPNHRLAVDLVVSLLRERGLSQAVMETLVTNAQQAKALLFPGSPTIRINGWDVEPAALDVSDFHYGCRTYSEAGKLSGIPSRDMVLRAIQHAVD